MHFYTRVCIPTIQGCIYVQSMVHQRPKFFFSYKSPMHAQLLNLFRKVAIKPSKHFWGLKFYIYLLMDDSNILSTWIKYLVHIAHPLYTLPICILGWYTSSWSVSVVVHWFLIIFYELGYIFNHFRVNWNIFMDKLSI